MTEQELEVLRLKLQILVLQELVRMLYSGLANTSQPSPKHFGINLRNFGKSTRKSL